MSFEEDNDRIKIRDELSTMSFEDLRKLKDKLGAKIYNEAIFGSEDVVDRRRMYNKSKIDFKRANKNRPRETSSKIQVPRYKEVVPLKKKIIRDPRYDSLCGVYNEKAFKNSYKFLKQVVVDDIKILNDELEEESDPKRVEKIKYLIRRLENRRREDERKEIDERKTTEEKIHNIEAMKRGEKTIFKKKSDKRLLELVERYEDLKKTGKLKKHIERLRKKKASKDRKKFSIHEANNE